MKKRLIKFLILILGIWLVVFLSQDLLRLIKKGERTKGVEKEAEELRLKNRSLKEEWEYVQGEDFVEKEAREKLNMAKEGEVIVVLPEELKAINQSRELERESLPNWQRWLKLFL